MAEPILDIIVPHYKESWTIMKPFFDMLNSQQGIDFSRFRVMIIHDGTFYIDEDCFRGYKYQIQQYQIPHKGVSAARNKGLEISKAEFVAFCDCDDCFSSIYALREIFYVLDHPDNHYDLLWGPFYTNMLDVNDRLVTVDTFNSIWVHCKFYRRSFLIDHDIRFCEYLYMSEDSAFNNIVMLEIGEGKIGEIHSAFPLYSWNRRRGSVTTDPEKILSNVKGHFYRNVYVYGEYRKRNAKNKEVVAVRTVTDAYSMLTKYERNDEIKGIEKLIARFYEEHKEVIDGVSEEYKTLALQASDREAGVDGETKKRPGVREWLDQIISETKTEEDIV